MGSSVPLFREPGGREADSVMGKQSRAVELWLVAGLFWSESGLFAALITDRLEVSQYLLLHFGSCATVAALGLCWIWRDGFTEPVISRTTVLLHGVLWIVLAGPFGALIVAALLLPRSTSVGRQRKLADQVAATPVKLTRVEALHSRLLDRRFRL